MDNSISDALTTVGTTLTSNISPSTVATIIGVVLGSGVALYLTWFGIRKLISVITKALRGRLSV